MTLIPSSLSPVSFSAGDKEREGTRRSYENLREMIQFWLRSNVHLILLAAGALYWVGECDPFTRATDTKWTILQSSIKFQWNGPYAFLLVCITLVTFFIFIPELDTSLYVHGYFQTLGDTFHSLPRIILPNSLFLEALA